MADEIDFEEVLRRGCFALDLKGTTKEAIIREMIDLMVKAGRIPDRQAALDAVLEREAKMSTGMQCGVAIPHGKTTTVDELVTALAIKRDGVDFESMDGQPSRIFVMTLSSVNRAGPHMQYLAEIGKLLSCPPVREALLEAETEEAMIRVLLDA